MDDDPRQQVDVSHPAAKSMIELSRAQDEEVGDGTTSVIILSKSYSKTLSHTSVTIFVRYGCETYREDYNGPTLR